jgi:hypothetical protein
MGETIKVSTQEEYASPATNNHDSGAPGPSSSRRRKLDHNSRTYDDMDDPADAETDSPLLKRSRRKQPEPASTQDRAIVPMSQEPSSSSLVPPPLTSEYIQYFLSFFLPPFFTKNEVGHM